MKWNINIVQYSHSNDVNDVNAVFIEVHVTSSCLPIQTIASLLNKPWLVHFRAINNVCIAYTLWCVVQWTSESTNPITYFGLNNWTLDQMFSYQRVSLIQFIWSIGLLKSTSHIWGLSIQFHVIFSAFVKLFFRVISKISFWNWVSKGNFLHIKCGTQLFYDELTLYLR